MKKQTKTQTKTMTRKGNPWMDHLSKVRGMKENKGKSLTDCMKLAKTTYKK